MTRGRPPKPPVLLQEAVLFIRLTGGEKAELMAKAGHGGGARGRNARGLAEAARQVLLKWAREP